MNKTIHFIQNKIPVFKIKTGFLFLLLFTSILFSTKSFAQKPKVIPLSDSAIKAANHSALMATLSSTFIPGLGQVYNKKYWKVPIIYATFATLIYSINYHNHQYNIYKQALATYKLPGPYIYYHDKHSDTELRFYIDQHQRLRDMSILGITLAYVLNIIDASVDANLFNYDITDDLSMKVQPFNNLDLARTTSVGLTFSFTLK